MFSSTGNSFILKIDENCGKFARQNIQKVSNIFQKFSGNFSEIVNTTLDVIDIT